VNAVTQSAEATTWVIFGGTFDPPHMGHVLAMAFVRAVHEPDRILMVPAFQHPFGKRASAPFEDRIHMCELAAGAVTGVTVSRIEQELGGVSLTLRTLEALAERHPGVTLRLLMGADALPETPKWHRWDRIVAMAPPIIVGRAGYERPEGCPFDVPDVSSSDLRRRLVAGGGAGGLVPAAVERHILDRGLYRNGGAP
jgi:nicotinate-nucleotide adenylyltransferase